jgi:hypothetical protein
MHYQILGWLIKEDETDGAFGMRGREEEHVGFRWVDLKERKHLED